ncbi:MAG: hypothetical protein ACOZQL_08325 [Myxococcota bacterium]
MELPASWAIQYRASFLQLAFLGFSVFVGLFFSLVMCGGVGFLVWSAARGTLALETRTTKELVQYALGGLFGVAFGAVMLRTTVGSLLDLVGVEVAVHGPVEELKALRGGRGVSYRMVVQGVEIEVPDHVYRTLYKGAPVRARAGRFERNLKELARPAGEVPR